MTFEAVNINIRKQDDEKLDNKKISNNAMSEEKIKN